MNTHNMSPEDDDVEVKCPQGGAMEPEEMDNDSFVETQVPVSHRVYVGNLAWHVQAQDLREHMERCGTVKNVDIFEDHNGRSKGCAIVEYTTAAECEVARRELTDTELMNRPIFVREDREEYADGVSRPRNRPYRSREGEPSREDGPVGSRRDNRGGRFAGGGGGGSRPKVREEDQGRLVFVANIPYKTSWQDLKDLFRKFGPIIRADVICSPDGRSRGIGTVLFSDAENAQAAIGQLHGHLYGGRLLTVRRDRS